MTTIPFAKPEEIGVIPARWQRVGALLKEWTDTGKVPAAGLCVGRKGRMLEPLFFGKQRPDADVPLRKDAVFLIASITKPVTAIAVMMLVERGLLRLEDTVAAYVPRFAAKGKKDVTIRHLLTHTSGLPDMLPNNEALRIAHKPFAAFIDETCNVDLLFPPGTKVSYQSMGIAMLAEIVHHRTGMAIRDFLRKEVFEPLGMKDTSLGLEAEQKERLAIVHLTAEQRKTDWNWMSPYWLGFGAPWGTLITSPTDLARLCQLMLNGGVLGDVRLLSPATVRAMTTNQLAALPNVPEEDRRCRPWGLGWKLNGLSDPLCLGDLVGPRTYGHWGAAGTICWIDPDAETYCILFTTEPKADETRLLVNVSNAIAAAFV